MRVTYIHQYFATRESPTCTRSYEFARRVVDRGHTVTIITSDAQVPTRNHSPRRTYRQSMEGIDVVVIPVMYSNKMDYRRRIGSFVRFAVRASWHSVREPADVVVALSTPLTVAVPGIAASFLRRVPMVFEVGDLWPEMPIAMGALRNPLSRALARGLEWFAYHASAQVVAFSTGMAEGVRSRGISPGRISVIPNGADLDLFDVPRSEGDAIRARIPGLGATSPLILYAGSFGRLYGIESLAKTASETRKLVPEARFLVIGEGFGRERLIDEARRQRVLDETLFIWDPLPKEDMPRLFAAADVVLSVMRPIRAGWVNSANKFFDALAAGRPLAINYGGWQAELLTETGAGIAAPDADPQEFAHALAEFIQDPENLRKSGFAARDLARREFDRDILGAQFIQLLESVAK